MTVRSYQMIEGKFYKLHIPSGAVLYVTLDEFMFSDRHCVFKYMPGKYNDIWESGSVFPNGFILPPQLVDACGAIEIDSNCNEIKVKTSQDKIKDFINKELPSITGFDELRAAYDKLHKIDVDKLNGKEIGILEVFYDKLNEEIRIYKKKKGMN